jgi:insertion element IS1 protein InsB
VPGLSHDARRPQWDAPLGGAPKKGPVSEERKGLIRRLLLERMSLQGIARATGVFRSWLQGIVNDLYREGTLREPGPLKKRRGG